MFNHKNTICGNANLLTAAPGRKASSLGATSMSYLSYEGIS